LIKHLQNINLSFGWPASAVALQEELRTIPNDIVTFFQNTSIEKIRVISQLEYPLYGGFVVRVRLAMQNREGMRVVGWRPHWAVAVDKEYRTEVWPSLPAPREFLTSQID
jgi:hypothetical protein